MRPFALPLLLSAFGTAPAVALPAAPAPILTTPEAHDTLSYAQPQIARVTHVDLDLKVDFMTRTVAGTAALDILARPGAKRIVLDDNKLIIARITDAASRPLKYSVGAYDDYKGAPLTVEIGAARRIIVPIARAPRRARSAGCRHRSPRARRSPISTARANRSTIAAGSRRRTVRASAKAGQPASPYRRIWSR
jgi:hypothetical protein